jgi:hypothetical protein
MERLSLTGSASGFAANCTPGRVKTQLILLSRLRYVISCSNQGFFRVDAERAPLSRITAEFEQSMADEIPQRLVFISHAGEDTWIARQIAREVTTRGARPFLDQADVDVGAEFEDDIRRFLDRANELIVLFTPWSLERPYVWAEIGAAWIRRIPIVVVLMGLTPAEFQGRPNTPVFLKKRDLIQLNQIDQYLDQLQERVLGERGNG